MDPSAPKRRKTSPTESVPVESTTPPGPPPSQPQREEPSEPQPDPRSSPSRPPQRPSFASPTTASLARHNPEVLNRRRNTASTRPDDLPASQPTSRDGSSETETAPTVTIPQRNREGDDSNTLPTGTGALPPVAAVEQSAPWSPMRRAGGNSLGAPLPRRTPTRPQSRPLPPPDQEEEILNPFMGRVLRRSPTNTGVISTVAHEEPTLPPTPQHPDPVVSTPPSGIHNTPSKRRRDDVEREAAQRASSPLKKSSSQEDRPQKPQKPQKQSQKAAVFKVARRESPAQTVEDVERIPSPPEPSETKSEKGFAPKTHPRRSVRLLGPDFEKIQKRDALLQEIAQLEEDLELARDEHVNAANGLSSKHESEKILDLLRRRLLPPEKEPEPDPSARWIDAAMDPFTMLGFNGQWSTQLPPILPPKTPEDDDQPPIISHHPIAMTASEELPYLQVFTPLSFTTNITTIPSDPGQINQTTHQRYTINVHSTSPPGLFTTRMEMVINTRSQAVASVAVSSLDPAAASELRPFIDSISNTKTPYHPALTRNVNILCFAMGEWYRVALKRAKFWHALDKNFGPESKDGVAKAVATMRTRKKRGRKARVASEAESELIDSLDGMDSLARLEAMRISKKELLPHMGRTSMNLDVPYLTGNDDDESSEVRVSWGVEFDWSGVAKNKLAVEVGVPGKWRAADERKSIVGIPKLFAKLLQGGEDPLAAVRTVVALLAGEPGP